MIRISDYQDIIQKIQDYQFVSFDLFDTLIKRDVYKPADVFQILENQGYPGFAEDRIASEKKARQMSTRGEVTLDEIYNYMHYDCSKEEIKLEKMLCTVNYAIKDVYDYCLACKKTIIITTDIYLDKDTIIQILDKCGYYKYDYLFVSSEYGQMKRDGSLFVTILKNLNIPAQSIIHIGDNRISDYVMPRKRGMASVLVNGEINNLSYSYFVSQSSDKLINNYWLAFINNHIRGSGHFYNAGYECFGPLLYGFVQWIIKKIEENNIEKVFFLSRDGEIIKKVFDTIYSGGVSSHYLFVSRRALLVPSLKIHKNAKDFICTYHFPYRFTAEMLCRMLGCEDSEIVNEVVDETQSGEHIFFRETIREDNLFEEVFSKILEKQNNYIERQYSLLNDYLLQEGFCGRLAIVDIGWYGNMQKNLIALTNSFGINADITGYYVAMAPSQELCLRQDMEGYLFDSFHNQEYHNKELLFNPAFELLFSGTHGTVLDYYFESSVKARMGDYEIEDSESLKLLRDYQRGAIVFCKNAKEEAFFSDIETEFIIKHLFKQFLRPSMIDAKKWGDITHEDNGTKKLVQFKNKRYYAFHLKNMISDYKSSLWKIGFLKQLLVGDFRYDTILVRLNSIKNKKIKGNGKA